MPNATSHRRPTLSTGARWTIIILTLFLLLGVGLVANGYWRAQSLIDRQHAVTLDESWGQPAQTDVERGRRLVTAVVRCGECHGPDLGGKVIVDSALGRVVAPNITPGAPTVASYRTVEDWIRTIRHGVGPSNRGLWMMPSRRFAAIGRQDVLDMIAYLKVARPVERALEGSDLSLLGMTMVGYGRVPLVMAEGGHGDPVSVAPRAEPTAEYGAYLARIAGCGECHGASLEGMTAPGMRAPGLVGGDAESWTLEEWTVAMRRGTLPGGGQLDDNLMPTRDYMSMTDTELAALWAFVRQPR